MLSSIKRFDVSKNHAITKERAIAAWDAMTREQRRELKKLDITYATFARTRDLGNISVKLAAAIALATGADPFYLTAEVAKNEPSDEDKIRQFIIVHGQEKALGVITDDSEMIKSIKKYNEPEQSNIEYILVQPPDKETITIEEFAGIQMKSMSPDKADELYNLSDEDVAILMKTLALQSKFSGRAKDLLGLLRLILIR